VASLDGWSPERLANPPGMSLGLSEARTTTAFLERQCAHATAGQLELWSAAVLLCVVSLCLFQLAGLSLVVLAELSQHRSTLGWGYCSAFLGHRNEDAEAGRVNVTFAVPWQPALP